MMNKQPVKLLRSSRDFLSTHALVHSLCLWMIFIVCLFVCLFVIASDMLLLWPCSLLTMLRLLSARKIVLQHTGDVHSVPHHGLYCLVPDVITDCV